MIASNIQTHVVTLKLLKSNGLSGLDYLKNHLWDSNAWKAYFSLSDLAHNDLLRESLGVLPKTLVVDISVRFAESVLPIFESKHPNDDRPRKAIEAAKAYIANPCKKTADAANASAASAAYAAYAAHAAHAADAADAADAAYDAAHAAAHAAARAAARAAYAAAYAAYAADAAAAYNAAYYAADAADAAANAAANAAADAAAARATDARSDFEKQQLNIVLEVIQEYSLKQSKLFLKE